MFELETKIDIILKKGILVEGTTVYVNVKLEDYKLSNDKGILSIDINLNEFVDSLSKKLGKVRLTNLIILCYKKLEELEKN